MIGLAALFLGAAVVSDLTHRPVRVKRTHRVGPYIIQRELWCELCLERGVGPWSNEQGALESIPEDAQERRLVYMEESALRRQLPPYDRDSPPEGSRELIHEGWIPIATIKEGPFHYDTASVQIWSTDDTKPTYGLSVSEHACKVHPWVVRLDAATDGLKATLDAKNKRGIVRALEDVQFWIGRLTCDLLSALEEPGHEDLAKQTAYALQRANEQVQRSHAELAPHRSTSDQYGAAFLAPLLTSMGHMAAPLVHPTHLIGGVLSAMTAASTSVAPMAAHHVPMMTQMMHDTRQQSPSQGAHPTSFGALQPDEAYGVFFLIPLIGAAIGPAAAALAKGRGKGKAAKTERIARHKSSVHQRLLQKVATEHAAEQAAAAAAAAAAAPPKPPAPAPTPVPAPAPTPAPAPAPASAAVSAEAKI